MKGYVILIASVAALGGLLFGFDTAVIAGTLEYLTKYFQLSNLQLGFVVGATSIGCIPGALVAGKLADTYGRKRIMILTALLYIIAALGSGLSGSFTQLIVYRLVGGLAIGMASTIAPIYISEIAPADFRGRLGMLQQLAIVTGILLSFISNYFIVNSSLSFLHADNYWRYMLGAAFIPSMVFFLLLLLVPESPRWLLLAGKTVKGSRIFEKIYGVREAVLEVKAVQDDIASEGAADAPLIFEKTKTGGSVLFQTLLTGIVNLIFTILAFWLIDRIGRKKLLLVGSGVMSVCMLALGILFWTGALGNYFVLVAVFLYIGGFACSWGAVLWVYVAEIYPNRIRGTATSIAVFGNWTANSIVSLSFPVMLGALGTAPTFFVYALLNAGMIWFVSRYIFETKGIPLERIEQAYSAT